MIEIFKKEARESELITYERIPRIFVSRNPQSGRQFIQLGLQKYTKVSCRHGITISIWSGYNEEGQLKNGITLTTENTTGDIICSL